MAALVQSILGTNASVTAAGPFTVTTGPATFSANTGAGNLLVFAGWMQRTGDPNSSGALPSTSGITWTALAAVGGDFGANVSGSTLASGTSIMYYAHNAPSVASTTGTAWSVIEPNSGTKTFVISFAMYEFSGVSTATAAAAIHNSHQVGGTPIAAVATTTAASLVLVNYGAVPSGSNVTAGTGYTLGFNTTVAAIGQTEYNLSVAAGTLTASFGSTQAASWGGGALIFNLAPSAATAFGYGFPSLIM